MSSQSDRIVQRITGVQRDAYKGNYEQDLLSEYLLYVQMADRISERRSTANTFFITVNTGLVSAFGLSGLLSKSFSPFVFLVADLAALMLCFFWYRLILSYRDLNTAKFKVIHEIEAHLPIRPYEAEWAAVGEGKDNSLYFPFTHIERFVPWVFMVLYVALLVNSFTISHNTSDHLEKTPTGVSRFHEPQTK